MAGPLQAARGDLYALLTQLDAPARTRIGAAFELSPGALGRAGGSRGPEVLLDALLQPQVQPGVVIRELRRCCPQALRSIDALASRVLPLAERIGRVAPSLPPLRRFAGREAELSAAHASLDAGRTTWICGMPGSGRQSVLARIGRDRLGQHSLVWTLRGPDPARVDLDLSHLAAALGLSATAAEARGWLSENSDWLLLMIDIDPESAQVVGPGVCACTAARAPTTLHEPPPAVSGAALDGDVEPTVRPALTLAWSADADEPAATGAPWTWSESHGALWREPEVRRPAGGQPAVVWLTDEGGLLAHLRRLVGGAGSLPAVLATLRGTLEPEEDALLLALAALGPAPVPLRVFAAPRLDGAPAQLVPLLRSRFTTDGAARRLVSAELARRDGGGLWLSGAVRAALAERGLDPAVDLCLAALLGEALADPAEDPRALLPHLHALAARLPVAVRDRLLARAGRALSTAEPQRARRYLRRALMAGALVGADRASAENDLGVMTRRGGDPAGARTLLRAALASDAEGGASDPEAAAGLHYHIALCCIDLGDTAGAAEALDAALGHLDGGLSALLAGLCALRHGQLAHATGQLDLARRWLARARRDLQRACAGPARVLELELTATGVEEAAGDRIQALRHAERAWALARSTGEPEAEAAARAALERLDA